MDFALKLLDFSEQFCLLIDIVFLLLSEVNLGLLQVFLLRRYCISVEVQLVLELLQLVLELLQLALARGDLVVFALQVSQEGLVPHID